MEPTLEACRLARRIIGIMDDQETIPLRSSKPKLIAQLIDNAFDAKYVEGIKHQQEYDKLKLEISTEATS